MDPTKALALVLLFVMVTAFCDARLLRLSKADKQAIVNEHNRLRSLTAKGRTRGQPPAANMAELEWDDRLMNSANLWVRQCIFKHDNSGYGQNLAAGSRNDLNRYIRMWFNEYKNYNFGANSCRGVCGHYTQVVWARTNRVGCGVAKCRGKYAYHMVCNYAPAGNIRGQRPYIRGQPATRCGREFRSRRNGLCVR